MIETKDTLSDCIRCLKKIRAQIYYGTNPSIITELDGIIVQLEQCLSGRISGREKAKRVERALEFISRLVSAVTNLSDIVDKYKW